MNRYFNSWIEAEEVKFVDDSSVLETDSYIGDSKKTTESPGKKKQPQQQQQQKKATTGRKNLEDLLLENDVFGGENDDVRVGNGHGNSSWCEMSADIDRYTVNTLLNICLYSSVKFELIRGSNHFHLNKIS